MTAPSNVAQFHAEYDTHTDDRIRLFGAIAGLVPRSARVLYPGSFVDIAPSVWFDDVTYIDTDKRAARFFDHAQAVDELVREKRRALDLQDRSAAITFHHLDYRTPLPEPAQSFDVLVSLYAGFISEHCTDHLELGGILVVNPSHGDAAMASIDSRYRLSGAIASSDGDYRVGTSDLGTYLIPKKDPVVTVESLHQSGRGVAYTRSPFAYLFTRLATPTLGETRA